jgi:DNA-binding MarR family transcriptional regulator
MSTTEPRPLPGSVSGPALGIETVAFYDALAERLGLNVTDLRCLELLVREPGISPGRIAELTGLTTGAVTGILDRLAAAGLARRIPDPGDRRRVGIEAVPEGVDALTGALEPLTQAMGALLDGHDEAGRAAIDAYLAGAVEVLRTETARMRAVARGGFVGDVYSAPLAGATRGRLVFASGAPRLSMNVAPLGPSASARIIMETSASRLAFAGAAPPDRLLRATFDGPLPEVRLSAGVVTIRYRRAPFTTRAARIALNGSIPWTIEVEGGLTDLRGSLDGVRLAGLEVRGGANHVDLALPAPAGPVPVQIRGVASSVVLKRPAEAPVALRVKGGISHLALDSRRQRSVSGDRRFATEAYATSPDRYEIEILDGASDVRVAPRQT